MKKLLNNPWISGTLALLAIALVAHSVMENTQSGPSYYIEDSGEYPEEESTQQAEDFAPIQSAFDAGSIQELAAQSLPRSIFVRKKEQPDPAHQAEEQVMAETTIRVKGIWIQNNVRYVIIDDQTLQSGQSIERVRVLRIEDQGVWLTSNEEQHFIKPGQSWTYRYPKPKDNSLN